MTLAETILCEHLSLEHIYQECCKTPGDINEHLPTLRRLASECQHVTELGSRMCVSTIALLHGVQEKLVCYDLMKSKQMESLLADNGPSSLEFHHQDVLAAPIAETDMLFIDTWHVYEQLKAELAMHSPKVRKYIVLHDTESFGQQGETIGHRGLLPALNEFLERGTFEATERFANNNGLTVLRRVKPESQAPESKPVQAAKIYLAIPYYQSIMGQVLEGYDRGVNPRGPNTYTKFPVGGSFACKNFNDAWCDCINTQDELGWSHFAMIHHDVTAYGFFLDNMLDIMRKHKADVLSVTLTIKDFDNLTSTAMRDHKTGLCRRFTQKELKALYPKETFSAGPGQDLLISSGLWIADIAGKDWPRKTWFEQRSRIFTNAHGKLVSQVMSEDWHWSYQLARLGLKVCATTAINADHWGIVAFNNHDATFGKEHDDDGVGRNGSWFSWQEPEEAPPIREEDGTVYIAE
jgi:hypothetical protein